MPREIFISYTTEDRAVADDLCAALETAGLSCWIAPRNIEPASNWTSSIMRAIEGCRIMVLVFSAKSNESSHVVREILHAVEKGRPVFPIRIEEVVPTGGLEYCLVGVQWFDATARPINTHVASLVEQMHLLLQRAGETPATPPPGVTAGAGDSGKSDQATDIYFQCEKCGQHLVTDAAAAGQTIPCPSCQNTVAIPPLPARLAGTERPATEKSGRGSSSPAALTLDVRVVADLKATLATFLGPMAKVLIDRAIARTHSISELLDLLATEIDSPDDRERFLRATAAMR